MSNRSRTTKTVRRWRATCATVAALILTVGMSLVASPASAYATNGCKWSTPNLNINISLTNGNFRTAINQALNNYTLGTDVNLTGVTTSGPTFTARNTNYGQTGWEGQNGYTCLFGVMQSSEARLNQYYWAGTTSQQGVIRVIWLHELGHGLGLEHVTPINRVMYTSASQAFNSGGV